MTSLLKPQLKQQPKPLPKPQGLTILIIEDQRDIAQNIADHLENRGHTIDYASDGNQGLTLALGNHYDVVILDLTMPGMDGLQVCRHIREQAKVELPILMLTARDTLDDKVKGFEVGADDYLTKPFALEELEVRCLALSRRRLLQSSHKISIGTLEIDRKTQQVSRENTELVLGSMNYNILLILAEAYPQVITRSELCQRLWGDEPTESDALRSHIYQLRRVLDKPFTTPVLKTVHGVGFVLNFADNQ
ncbi:MAG: DNA-binding response OmpR family regulator [Phenylobacterium sp.]|jgi:DNA-binding response OmpR family regulator